MKDRQYLESLGYKFINGYIQQYIDSETEPKKYWPNRPQTFEYQICGWQIVAHEHKTKMFADKIRKEKQNS